jgi:hypothetical protein
MTRHVYLLHDMGEKGEDWAASAIALLRDRADACGVRARLDAQVVFEPLHYGDVFDQILAHWDSTADALEERAREQGADIADVIDWLRPAADDVAGFFWSHAVDILLYRFFPQVARQVRAHVLDQLGTSLEEAMLDGRANVSVLAHGLGTAVAHDALAFLGSRPLGGSHALTAGNFRFDTLFMIANVSRALESDFDVYRSVVHPASIDPGTAYTGHYFNFRHRLDPLPSLRPFAPAGWGRFYHAVEDLEHVLDFDVHALEHYLRHPRVHIPILNRLLDDPIDDATAHEALARFATEPGPPCSERMKMFARRLAHVGELLAAHDEPVALVRAAAELLGIAKETADECR